MTAPNKKRIGIYEPPAGAPESEKAVLIAAIVDREQQPAIIAQLDPDYFTNQEIATLAGA